MGERQLGGRLAPLHDDARAALDRVLPPTWSRANPIDIIGDADPARYQAALDIVLSQPDQNAILVMNCPTGVADSLANAKTVLAAAPKARAPMLTCWLGEETARVSRLLLTANKIPAYETPDEAVRAFMHLVDYRRNQNALIETPAASIVAHDAHDTVKRIITDVLADGRSLLTEPEAKAVLTAYGIASVPTFVARTAEDTKIKAASIDGPIALKILSRDISHKSDVGGVRLSLTRETIEQNARDMLAAVRAKAPEARIDGFTVQPMITRPRAIELIAGLSVDPTFGPVILFGQGGTSVEIVADRAMALPPLNSVLARDVISRTRIAKLLAGYRDVPAADMAAIQAALIGLADLAADHAEIIGVDINPLLADRGGVIALDARIEVRKAAQAAEARFAIRPYPAGLRREVETRDGERFILRAIRPQDEPALVQMAAQSTPEDMRLRFHGPMRELNHMLAARLTQIDYDREMAFVAEQPSLPGIFGVSRLTIDPDFKKAEFAIMVRSDMKGAGLGYQLMRTLIDYARLRGVETIIGYVLRENDAMLQMARAFGGTTEVVRDDVSLMRAVIPIRADTSAASPAPVEAPARR